MSGEKRDLDGCRDKSSVCVELMEAAPGICQDNDELMTHFCQVRNLTIFEVEPLSGETD